MFFCAHNLHFMWLYLGDYVFQSSLVVRYSVWFYLKNCFICGAKYHTKNITAAVVNTGIAISGLVRNVIFAIAKRDIATRSFSKAKNQPIKEVMNFWKYFNCFPRWKLIAFILAIFKILSFVFSKPVRIFMHYSDVSDQSKFC